MATEAKLKRLEARITEEQKARFERAARLQGRTLTDFMVGTLEEVSSKIIREHDVLTLAGEDSRAFAQALLEPQAPSDIFLRAVEDYHEHIEER